MGAGAQGESPDGTTAVGGGTAARSVLPSVSLDPPREAVTVPNSARMVDYFLGGSANFGADRRAAAALTVVDPLSPARIRANRVFAVRALRWCVQHGIDQVLDLGCGISAVRSTHATVHAVDPGCRVAYVDVDPVVTHHVRAVVAGIDRVSVTQADLGRPAEVLAAPGVTAVLDLARPVVVLASGSPHWVAGDLTGVFDGYRAALAPGSALVLSQRTHDALVDVDGPAFDAEIQRSLGPMVLRTRREVAAAFTGFELVDPGVVDVTQWPVAMPGRAAMSYWGGLGILR